jgi:hypothetical protein
MLLVIEHFEKADGVIESKADVVCVFTPTGFYRQDPTLLTRRQKTGPNSGTVADGRQKNSSSVVMTSSVSLKCIRVRWFCRSPRQLLAKQNHVEIEPLCSPLPRGWSTTIKTPSSQKVGEVWWCPRLSTE